MLHENLDILGRSEAKPVRGAKAAMRTAAPSALTVLAHDLRAPLASLGLLIELIETQSARASASKITASAKRAINIIDGLEDMLNAVLDRVRKSGDPLGFQPKTVAFEQVTKIAIITTLPVAERRSVPITYQLDEPVRLRGDEGLLLQVVENLVGNAVKHSGPGMPVTCDLRQVGDQAVLRVRDKGNGMTAADLQRAFYPFTKLSSKSSDPARSWGVGLWIVKLIVEQHGGRISATSDGPGKGSEFSVHLPLAGQPDTRSSLRDVV